ncbi:hypothetical protein [Mycoplasma seminis]|uniref:Extracellular matrix-binding protein ebh GA module domain-containing protein n=1 Tax=Mycoplasma seminis TaxID=512749 RepID=A0ABY9H9T8_9MOLU|nr:hypothetical protein [Mycoplasma seminis]WLP85337.1 hypothetical protein Q8852_03380 [Mycoplasma seminis]
MSKKNKIILISTGLATAATLVPLVAATTTAEENIPAPSPDFGTSITPSSQQYWNPESFYNSFQSNWAPSTYKPSPNNPVIISEPNNVEGLPQNVSPMNAEEQTWTVVFDAGQFGQTSDYSMGLALSADLEFVPGSFYISVGNDEGNWINNMQISELDNSEVFSRFKYKPNDPKGNPKDLIGTYGYPYSKDSNHVAGPIKYGNEWAYIQQIVTSNGLADLDKGAAFNFISDKANLNLPEKTAAIDWFKNNFYTIGRAIVFYTKFNTQNTKMPKYTITFKTRKYVSKDVSAYLYDSATGNTIKGSGGGAAFISAFWAPMGGDPRYFTGYKYTRTGYQDVFVNTNLNFHINDGSSIPSTVARPKFKYEFLYGGSKPEVTEEFTESGYENKSKQYAFSYNADAGMRFEPNSTSGLTYYNPDSTENFFIENNLSVNAPTYQFTDDITMYFSNEWYQAKTKLVQTIKDAGKPKGNDKEIWSKSVVSAALDYLRKKDNNALKYQAKDWTAAKMNDLRSVKNVKYELESSKELIKLILDKQGPQTNNYKYADTKLQEAYDTAYRAANAIVSDSHTISLVTNTEDFATVRITRLYNALKSAANALNGEKNLQTAKETINNLNNLTEEVKKHFIQYVIKNTNNGSTLSDKVKEIVNVSEAFERMVTEYKKDVALKTTDPKYLNATNQKQFDDVLNEVKSSYELTDTECKLDKKTTDPARFTKEIQKMKAAYDALDGIEKLNEAKTNAAADINKLNNLSSALKTKYINDINAATVITISKVNEIKEQATNLNTQAGVFKEDLTKYTNYATDNKYKYATNDLKQAFKNQYDTSNGLFSNEEPNGLVLTNDSTAEALQKAQSQLDQAYDALDGTKNLQDVENAINALPNLSPEQKTNLVNKATATADKEALDKVLKDAQTADNEAFQAQKDALKDQIDSLNNLTDKQKETAKENIQNAKNLADANTAKTNADSLNTNMGTLKDLIKDAEQVKKSSDYINDPEKQADYNNAIANADNAIKAQDSNLTPEQVKQYTDAINTAKAALKGEEKLKAAKETAINNLANLTNLNPAQKEAAQKAINDSTTLDDVTTAKTNADDLNTAMGQLKDAITSGNDAKGTNNFTNASEKLAEALTDALTEADTATGKDGAALTKEEVNALKDKITDAVSNLDGNSRLQEAISTAETSLGQLNNLSQEVINKYKEELKTKTSNSDVNAVVTKATSLNAKAGELLSAISNNQAIVSSNTDPRYVNATNQNVLTDAIANANKLFNNNKLINDSTVEQLTQEIEKLNTAYNKLNGLDQLAKAKAKATAEINKMKNLSEYQKQSLNQQISESNDESSITTIKQGASQLDTAMEAYNKAAETYKDTATTPNYKYSSTATQEAFTNANNAVQEQQNKLNGTEIMDPATINSQTEALNNAATALNGANNIEKATKDINALTNLPEKDRKDYIAKAKNTTNKQALEDVVQEATNAANQALANAKTAAIQNIDSLKNLTKAQKDKLIENVKEKTDIADVNTVERNATTLDNTMQAANTTNNDKSAVEKSSNYVNASETAKAAYDTAIKALSDALTAAQNKEDPNLLDNENIKKLTQAVETAKTNLDGDSRLSQAKTAQKAEIDKLKNLNTAQITAAKQAIDDANTLDGISTAVETAKQLNTAMGELNSAVATAKETTQKSTNYIDSSADKQTALNTAIENAEKQLPNGARQTALTKEQVEALKNAITKATNELDGAAELEKAKTTAKTTLDALSNLSPEVIKTFKDQLPTATSKQAVADIIENAEKLNTAVAEMKQSIDKYQKVVDENTDPKYVNATNKTALTTPLSTAQGLLNEKGQLIANNTVDGINKAKTNIANGYNALDGDTQLSNAKNQANNYIDGLTNLSKAQKDALKTKVNAATKISDIDDIKTTADTLNTNMGAFNKAASDNATTADTPAYKYAETAKQNEFNNALKAITEQQKQENGVAEIDPATIAQQTQALTTAASALDGAKNLDNANKAIEALSNLTPEQKQDFKTQASQTNNKEALDEVVKNATQANADALANKKAELKKQLESLTNLTPNQKAQAIEQIDVAADNVAAQSAYDNANTLNTNMGTLNSLINDAPNVKASSNYVNDPAHQAAYNNAIDAATQAKNDTKQAPLSAAKVKELTDAIENAKTALNGEKLLEQDKTAKLAELDKLTHLNPAQKEAATKAINDATTTQGVADALATATALNNAMDALQQAANTAEAGKGDVNYTNASVDKQQALTDAINAATTATAANGTNLDKTAVDKLAKAIADAVKGLNGDSNLTTAKTNANKALDKLNNLSQAVIDAYKTEVAAATSDTAVKAIVDKATALNNKVADLQSTINTYEDKITNKDPKYVNATNKDSLDNPLNAAKALLDKENKLIANNTVDGIATAIKNIQDGYTNLDGDTVLTNAKDTATKAIDAMKNLSAAQKAALKEQVSAANDTATIDGIATKAQSLDDAMQKFNQAASDNATTATTPAYKYADSVKQSEFDKALKAIKDQQDLAKGTTQLDPEQIKKDTQALTQAAAALNGAENIKKAKDTINALENLTPEEKENFLSQAKVATNNEALQAVVSKAQAANTKALADKKAQLQKAVDSLSNLTENQKTKAKEDIANATNVANAQNQYDAANDLNTATGTLKDLIKQQPEVQKTNNYINDPAHQGAYNTAITNATNALNDTEQAPLSAAKVAELTKAIKDAKAALDGDKILKDKKADAIKNLDKTYPNLTPEQKQTITDNINSATDLDNLDNVLKNAKSVNDKMDVYNKALQAVNKDSNNFKLADDTKKQALTEALAKKVNDLTDPGQIQNAIDAITTANNALNGDDNLTNANKAIDALDNLSKAQKDALKQTAATSANKEALDTLVNNATNANTNIGTLKDAVKLANAVKEQLSNNNNVTMPEDKTTAIANKVAELDKLLTDANNVLNNNIDTAKVADIATLANSLTTSANKARQEIVAPAVESLQEALQQAKDVTPANEALQQLIAQGDKQIALVPEMDKPITYPNNVFDVTDLTNKLTNETLRNKLQNVINALPQELTSSPYFKETILNNANATVANPAATNEELQAQLDKLDNIAAKTPLYQEIDNAKDVYQPNANLQTALNNAIDALNSPDNKAKDQNFFTQEAEKLAKSIASDKLDKVIAQANAIDPKSNNLSQAIATANGVYNNPNSTTQELNDAAEALEKAIKEENLQKAKDLLNKVSTGLDANKLYNAPQALQDQYNNSLKQAQDFVNNALASGSLPTNEEMNNFNQNVIAKVTSAEAQINLFPAEEFKNADGAKETYVANALDKLKYLNPETKAKYTEAFNAATTNAAAEEILANAAKENADNSANINAVIENLTNAVNNKTTANVQAANDLIAKLTSAPAAIVDELNAKSSAVSELLNANNALNTYLNTDYKDENAFQTNKNALAQANAKLQNQTANDALTQQLVNTINSANTTLKANEKFVNDLIQAIEEKDAEKLNALTNNAANVNSDLSAFVNALKDANYLAILSKEPKQITRQDVKDIQDLVNSDAFRNAPELLRSLIKDDFKTNSAFPWWAWLVIVSGLTFLSGIILLTFKK